MVLALVVLATVGVMAIGSDREAVTPIAIASPPPPPPAAAVIEAPRPIELPRATPASATPHAQADTLDPCAPLRAPEIPSAFESQMIDGITIAWDPALEIEAATLAYLTKGLVVQASIVTSSVPRDQLAVVIYATADDLRAQTAAPAWARGLYDGAVRLVAAPHDDFGIVLETLRHEVMHAQLHAGVGCMPAWLDEGVALYFGHELLQSELLDLLSGSARPSLDRLQVSSIVDAVTDSPLTTYAQGYAMLLFALGRGHPIAEIMQRAHRLGPRAPARLWSDLFPGVDDRDVLDALAQRIFSLPAAAAATQIASGTCCTRNGVELTCVAATARPERRKHWIEQHRMCRASE